MSQDEGTLGYRPVKDAHKALGLWSIRRALTLAFCSAVVLLVAAWFFISWLLGSPSHAKPKPLDTTAQLELLKLVFALVAGVGALVALITAYRRQRVDEAAGERAERVQAHAEHDATERRVTELYGQAVEQLGHEKAAVRLGGLYSLERLGQDHAQHRQTVIDVVCAYLRMPFQPPVSNGGPPLPSEESGETRPPTEPDDGDTRQELQVRLAAQRLLHRHLAVPSTSGTADRSTVVPHTYWHHMLIDLTGAHLVDFDFSQCRVRYVDFRKASFSGDAWFSRAHFSGPAWFSEARFGRDARFGGARFGEDARFHTAWFGRDAEFGGAQFSRPTRFGQSPVFDGARFSGRAHFDGARFDGDTRFHEVRFGKGTSFGGAQFSGYARFSEAQFSGSVKFSGVRFRGDADFGGAEFCADPDFTDATAGHPNNRHTWPETWRTEPSSSSGTASLVRRQ